MALLAQEAFPLLPSEGEELAAGFARPDFEEPQTGFQGAIANLTLTDVIQLEGRNLFSGSILVSYQDQEGKLFFQQGELVHAEVGSYSGEDAFRRILAWPGGSFRLLPNVTSLRQSIQKRLDHLILSAHQWLDETRHTQELEAEDTAVPRRQGSEPARGLGALVQGVPGVACAVMMDRAGKPRGEAGLRGEGLAARGIYLASQVAEPLGEALGLGDFQVATLQGGEDRILLFRSKETYLAVGLGAEAVPDEAEAGVRQALARRAGR